MKLTRKQEEGLSLAVARYYNHDPYTVISGYAGTGKSTLVKFIIAALDLDPADVTYVAYTGKAALVLKNKGCPNATTAHRLLYNSRPRKDGTFYHQIKRPLDHKYKLIVVDEVSMLPLEMWELLLSHHIHVIALGDPGQLAPVSGKDNNVLEHPDIFLDEVMRQAQDSEIIRLSMDIRDGKPLELFQGEDVMVIDQLSNSMMDWADQILVGKNKTRHTINNFMRKRLYGVEDRTPIEGDKIICLKNDWKHPNALGDVLVNGLTGRLSNIHLWDNVPFIGTKMIGTFLSDEYDESDYVPPDAYFYNKQMDYKIFAEGEATINKDNFRTMNYHNIQLSEFDYAYCITTHKAQGSEYNKVLVLEEYLKGSKEDHQRWLYTAVTRSSQKVVVVRDYRNG